MNNISDSLKSASFQEYCFVIKPEKCLWFQNKFWKIIYNIAFVLLMIDLLFKIAQGIIIIIQEQSVLVTITTIGLIVLLIFVLRILQIYFNPRPLCFKKMVCILEKHAL
jgi:hypothetical protein